MTPTYVLLSQIGGGSWLTIAPMVAIFVVFYLLLILPQQKRQKKWQQMLNELKSGDRITTSGGIQGTILSIKEGDGTVVVRIPPDNIKMEISRSSIASVRTEDAKS